MGEVEEQVLADVDAAADASKAFGRGGGLVLSPTAGATDWDKIPGGRQAVAHLVELGVLKAVAEPHGIRVARPSTFKLSVRTMTPEAVLAHRATTSRGEPLPQWVPAWTVPRTPVAPKAKRPKPTPTPITVVPATSKELLAMPTNRALTNRALKAIAAKAAAEAELVDAVRALDAAGVTQTAIAKAIGLQGVQVRRLLSK